MSAIHAVLMAPWAGDPLGLLAEGVCGARPPMAVQLGGRQWHGGWHGEGV